MSKRILYNITSASLQATNISGGTISGTTFTGGSLSLSGNLNVAGTLTTVNITSTNLVNTNISSGTVSATTFTGGSLSLSGNLNVAGTLTTVNITSTNLVNTNVSAGVVVASTSLSATGNSNTIGNIFTTAGNVGIGTTSPAYKLDVNGLTRINTTRGVLIGSSTDLDSNRLISALDSGMPGNSDRYIAFGKAASNNNQAELAFSNVTTGSSSNYLGLGIYGSRTMAINGAGNVGIGTTSPETKLDVSGTARITTSVTTGALYSTNQTSTNIVGTNISSGTLNLSTGLTSASAKISNIVVTNISTNSIIIDNSNNSNGIQVGVGTGNTTSNLNLYGSFTDGYAIIQVGSTNNNSPNLKIVRSASVNGTIANFQVYSQTSAFIGGNVGIGTTSPGGALHVTGLISGTSGNGISMGMGVDGNSGIQLNSGTNGSSNASYIDFGYTGNDYVSRIINFNNSRSLQFQVNGGGTSSMTIASTGNVGIGTTSPIYPLHVVGQVGGEGGVWATTYYYHTSNNQGGQYIGWVPDQGAVYTIRANGRMAASAFDAFSDIRIKKNIQDVDDVSALDTLRLIQPKLYNYIDEGFRGTKRVWGFIAQQVKSVMNYAVNTSEEFVPDIFSLCTVGNLNQSTSTLILSSPSDITVDTKLRLIMETGDYKDVIVKTVAENLLTVDCKIEQEKVFVYGKNVTDFHTLNKEAIFTVAVAALQEVDRELQTEKQEHTQTKQQLQILSSKMDSLIQKLNGKYPGEFEL